MKQETLKEYFEYNKETGIFYIKKKRKNSKDIIGEKVGGIDKSSGYVQIMFSRKKYYAHRLAWIYEYGDTINEIDHINHNRQDNRILNLRNIKRTDNNKNISLKEKNNSGACGVCWSKKIGKWHSFISSNKKKIHLGYFIDFEKAVSTRKNAEVKYGYHINHGKGEVK